ncbi:hypothetical protein NGA_0725400, partial [Nannochloropsis gaditana CCMP526]
MHVPSGLVPIPTRWSRKKCRARPGDDEDNEEDDEEGQGAQEAACPRPY